MRSQLAPIIKVARMLNAHFVNSLTYLTHRATNAMNAVTGVAAPW